MNLSIKLPLISSINLGLITLALFTGACSATTVRPATAPSYPPIEDRIVTSSELVIYSAPAHGDDVTMTLIEDDGAAPASHEAPVTDLPVGKTVLGQLTATK